MDHLEPTGGDDERMLFVETRLRTEITDIDALVTGHISTAQTSAPDAAVSLGHAVALAGTFCQETGLVAKGVLGSRQSLGFADGPPVDLNSLYFWLNHSLDDSDGATNAPSTVAEAIAREAFLDGARLGGLDDVEQLLDATTTDAERRAIWDSLAEADRLTVIMDRPDLGVTFLEAGALDVDELDLLSDATSYTLGSTKLELTVDGKFELKLFTVTFGGGVSMTVQRLSDGTFKVLVGANAYGGVARELDANGVEVSAELRAVIESGQVLQFGTEQEVLDAIAALEQAIEDDASDWVGTGRYVGGVLIDANPVFGLSRLLGGPSPGQWLDGDQRPESIKALEQLMEAHGASTRVAVGVEGSASAELDAVGLGGLEGTAKISIVVYHVDGQNGTIDSNGVVVAGSLNGSFTRDSTPLVPGTSNTEITGGGTIGFSSDTSVDADGNIVNVTTLYVETKVGTVGSLGLGDTVFGDDDNPAGSSITLEQSTDVTQRHTVTISTPVDDETDELVADAATGLASGNIDGVLDLYDAADVTVISEDGVRVTGTVGVDLDVVEVKVSVATTDTITTAATHKPAGGEPYDQIEVSERIDLAANDLEQNPTADDTTMSGAGSGGGGSSTSWN